jgi:hypothetical protein
MNFIWTLFRIILTLLQKQNVQFQELSSIGGLYTSVILMIKQWIKEGRSRQGRWIMYNTKSNEEKEKETQPVIEGLGILRI